VKMNEILRLWDKIEIYITGVLVGLAALSAFYQVVMRYVFSNAPEWVEESVLYLVIWAVFIVASRLVRLNEHVGADFLIRKTPLGFQRGVEIVNCFLSLLFLILVIWYGFYIAYMSFDMGETSQTQLRFPMWISYIAVPVGGCLILLSYFVRVYLLIFRFDPELVQKSRE